MGPLARHPPLGGGYGCLKTPVQRQENIRKSGIEPASLVPKTSTLPIKLRPEGKEGKVGVSAEKYSN